MPISKKEINKEMMFNKIMPSGFASKKIGEANAIKDSIQEAEKAEEQELKNLGKARNKKKDEPTLHADIKPSEKAVPDKPLTIAEEEKPKEDNSEPLVLNGDTAEDIKKQEKKTSKSRSKKKNAENNEEQKPEAIEDTTEEIENTAEEAVEEAADETAPESEQPKKEDEASIAAADNAQEAENTFNTADKSGPLTLEKKAGEEKAEEKEEPKAEAKPASNQPVMVNIYEKMVLDKVDAAIAKFKCCSCYLCHQDIVTMALNNLKPKYIVAVEDDIPNLLQKENSSEVTSAIMKAILHVKANPRH